MVQTRSQTKKLQQEIEKQQIENQNIEKRQIQERQIQEKEIEEQNKRNEIASKRQQYNDNYWEMESDFSVSIKKQINKCSKLTDHYMKFSLIADIFTEITEYLPIIITFNNIWVKVLETAYEKLYEFYNELYIYHKPRTIDQLCVMNRMVRTLQIAQPIIRSLMLTHSNIILKDEIQFRLYDISELSK